MWSVDIKHYSESWVNFRIIDIDPDQKNELRVYELILLTTISRLLLLVLLGGILTFESNNPFKLEYKLSE